MPQVLDVFNRGLDLLIWSLKVKKTMHTNFVSAKCLTKHLQFYYITKHLEK